MWGVQPSSQGGGAPASPKFLALPTWVHTVRKTTTDCSMVIKLDMRKIFTGSTTNADARSVCGS